MKNGLLRYRLERNNTEASHYGLRRVPQRPVSVCEIISYAILPFLLIMCGAMPSTALFFIPIVLGFLYVLYRRFGVYFPLVCIAGYGVLALTLNYDILSVICFCGLTFAFCGLVLGAQQKHYLAYAACVAVLAIAGALIGAGIVRLAEDKPVKDIASTYILREQADPFISFLSREYYDDMRLPSDEVKLIPSDPEYDKTAARSFAEHMGDDLALYIWYYCIHYGAVIAAVGFFISVYVNSKTSSFNDIGATENTLKKSTRALGGVGDMTTKIADMRMPRSYLWSCLLPAAVASIVLQLVGGFDALSATFMHAFATLPSAFACFTLLAYFASLFKGKGKIIAHIVLCMVGVAAVLFPIALFALSVVGICDCIINIRFWVKFISED